MLNWLRHAGTVAGMVDPGSVRVLIGRRGAKGTDLQVISAQHMARTIQHSTFAIQHSTFPGSERHAGSL
jgi:hypothetical protein